MASARDTSADRCTKTKKTYVYGHVWFRIRIYICAPQVRQPVYDIPCLLNSLHPPSLRARGRTDLCIVNPPLTLTLPFPPVYDLYKSFCAPAGAQTHVARAVSKP